MPLLENKIIAIENVWLSYTDKNILEDINLDIYQGDFLLITQTDVNDREGHF